MGHVGSNIFLGAPKQLHKTFHLLVGRDAFIMLFLFGLLGSTYGVCGTVGSLVDLRNFLRLYELSDLSTCAICASSGRHTLIY